MNEENENNMLHHSGNEPEQSFDTPPQSEPEQPEDGTNDISQRLSQRDGENENEERRGDEPTANEPLSFDISKLTAEQLSQLKAMLNATPDRARRKKENPRVFLREIDGKVAVDFKNAYLTMVRDHELRADVERHVIPVKFLGETDYTNIMYERFMSSPQISCEIISTKKDVDEEERGSTISMEHGRQVPMLVTRVNYTFTVKLPNGEQVEIDGKVANG